MTITESQIKVALQGVRLPLGKKNIVEAGHLARIDIQEKTLLVSLQKTGEEEMVKKSLRFQIKRALKSLAPDFQVDVDFVEGTKEETPAKVSKLPKIKHMIAIASGKGGVGKSAVSVNLAFAFQKLGYRVGILDCDVYGPSIPTMLGVEGAKPYLVDGQIEPIDALGVKVMSAGFFVPAGQGVVWRGPMLHKMIQQFVLDVNWEGLDLMVIDLPPGTGDVGMSIAQTLPLTGTVLVSTPQKLSILDMAKGASMFDQLKVPVLGVIENMSHFQCPSCDHSAEIFSRGGVKDFCDSNKYSYLGDIPLDPRIRECADHGRSFLLSYRESPAAESLFRVAEALQEQWDSTKKAQANGDGFV